MDSKFIFWWRWLVVAAIAELLFGLSLVTLPHSTQQFFNFLFFSSDQGAPIFEVAAVNYITFVCAVLGAVMCGWAVLLLYVLIGPFRRGLSEGWNMIAVSLGAWFVPDTVISLWSGFWQNAVLNLVFGILFAIPLVATYRAFHDSAH
ncbi:MAG: hypothetical protein Q7R50_02970 [Dehalococcoidales bacterium]|nr:hypothetical protein [Dehalococcoidales bacterium]